jgi:peptide/nickel transport system substrate-binding protein
MLNFIGLDEHRDPSPFVLDEQGKKATPNPLKNRKVREALALAVNRDLIARNVMKGDATPAAQLVPEGFFGYDPSIKLGAPDPAKAKALLAEAGYPKGFRLMLHCSNDRYPNDARVCEAVGQMFTQIGVKTDVQTMPFSVFVPKAQGSATEEPAYSAWMIGIGAVTGDSLQPMVATLNSFDAKAGTGANNFGRYSNKDFDALIRKANESLNPAEREQLQRQAAEVAMSDFAVLPIQHLKAVWAFKKGLVVTPRADGFTLATAIREGAAK